MLQPIMHRLNNQRIILASGSPRRKEILENVGLKFDVMPSKFEENLHKDSFRCPSEYVEETARRKTLEVAKRMVYEQKAADLLIGADTVVTMDGRIYEKPDSTQSAMEMLQEFSGRKHTVYTGVVLVTPKIDDVVKTSNLDDTFFMSQFHCATDVHFAPLSRETIAAYVATGEPMDKAGGYGIQALGGTLIEGINGDYFNVMGFPLHQFCRHLLQHYDKYDTL